MSVTTYLDPPNKEDIILSVKNAEKHYEVIDIINSTFPTWILGCPQKYSKDYEHFQNNWKYVCKKSQCEPLNIVIVDMIEFNDKNYTLIKLFSELLTCFGHSVRRKEEFIECKACGDAIPTQSVYNQLVERKIDVPTFWSMRCKGC